MKSLALTISLFIGFLSYGQLDVNTSTSKVIYENLVNQKIKIKVRDTDTAYMFIYNNQKYKTIVDIKIGYFTPEEIVQFFDLCLYVSETKENVDTSKYSIRHFTGTSVMVFIDGGYTTVQKNNIVKMKTAVLNSRTIN